MFNILGRFILAKNFFCEPVYVCVYACVCRIETVLTEHSKDTDSTNLIWKK